MASVVAAMDGLYPEINMGENGRNQHNWSSSIKDQIVQLNFQIVRQRHNSNEFNFIAEKFENIYQSIIKKNPVAVYNQFHLNKEQIYYLNIMHKLIVFTRDIVKGKGEYMLAYAMLHRVSLYNEKIAQQLIYLFVEDFPDLVCKKHNIEKHPYGSWKDIKYLWENFEWSKYMKVFMIKLTNERLRADQDIFLNRNNVEKNYSLVSRWIPRENSKFKDMFFALAEDYFDSYIATATNSASLISAKKKAYCNYRKIVANLNKQINTTQISQCNGSYSEIDYNTVTSITMAKQKTAFLNIKTNKKTGKKEQRSEKEDRITGAENYRKYLENLFKEGKSVKGKRVGINDFVKDGIKQNNTIEEISIIDSQWNDFLTNLGPLGNLVAMVDTSGSMNGDPKFAAVGLGCAVAAKSKLGRRVLTFDREPHWVNLENETGFCEQVNKVYDCAWGMNTNFTLALKKILDACVEKKLSEFEVSNMVLVIFSDMQIDYPGNEPLNQTMWEHITFLYAEKGYKVIPHILFWNLRHTGGFPVSTNQPGATMFSGYSPAILNNFCEKGIDALKEITPWSSFMELLDVPRYNIVSL